METIAVQLVSVSDKELTAKTESNQLIKIATTANNKRDRSFWQSLKDIARAKIWVPVTKGTHQLLQYDWLTVAPEMA
ncbi:hypothetical protein FC82_GL000755 [Secundilactobacillus collinoides DSM 20515 = JCM 1123]|uniref:Uncharacterized protein n=2 Tax=Secundilactobacillus collinoides TaxID=33960 RepID=A0A0R2BC87_SECCO|nr:hypothetical protein FC82_GL000755 [Secundilactobacillus collinoides DSM 20515 = JCM 1123]